MSFPAWAIAPVIGEMNPILIGAWASASPAPSMKVKAIKTDRIELMVRMTCSFSIELLYSESFSPLAVFAGRVVARVHRILQILVRLVRPELRDVRKSVDHAVLEPSTDPLHLSEIDVLNRVTVLIEPNRPPRSIREFYLAQRPCEPLAILGVSTDGLGHDLELKHSHVCSLRIVRGDLLEPCLIGLGELSIPSGRQRCRVVQRRDDSYDFITHVSEDVL